MDAGLLDQVETLAGSSRLSRVLVNRIRAIEPGDCCTEFWADMRAPFPDDVSYLSIWSRIDGVVNPRACHDPAARLLEVRSSHCGMAFNRHVYGAVLTELGDVAARERGAGADAVAA